MANKVKVALKSAMKALLADLSGLIVELPSAACKCGKPIVFVYPSRVSKCARCGSRWALKVEIVKKGKK
jgi:hypothetical protein